MDTGAIVIGLFGGGTIATLVTALLKRRADNARTFAEGHKLDAEGDATITDAIQRRYDALFDGFERELVRLNTENETLRQQLNAANLQLGQLRVEAANATADVQKATEQVKRARDEIVRLEDRVAELEAR